MGRGADFDFFEVATHPGTVQMEFDAGLIIKCKGVPFFVSAAESTPQTKFTTYGVMRLFQQIALAMNHKRGWPSLESIPLAGSVQISHMEPKRAALSNVRIEVRILHQERAVLTFYDQERHANVYAMMKHEVVGHAPGFAKQAPVASMKAVRARDREVQALIPHLASNSSSVGGVRLEVRFGFRRTTGNEVIGEHLDYLVRKGLQSAWRDVELVHVFDQNAYHW